MLLLQLNQEVQQYPKANKHNTQLLSGQFFKINLCESFKAKSVLYRPCKLHYSMLSGLEQQSVLSLPSFLVQSLPSFL